MDAHSVVSTRTADAGGWQKYSMGLEMPFPLSLVVGNTPFLGGSLLWLGLYLGNTPLLTLIPTRVCPLAPPSLHPKIMPIAASACSNPPPHHEGTSSYIQCFQDLSYWTTQQHSFTFVLPCFDEVDDSNHQHNEQCANQCNDNEYCGITCKEIPC